MYDLQSCVNRQILASSAQDAELTSQSKEEFGHIAFVIFCSVNLWAWESGADEALQDTFVDDCTKGNTLFATSF